MAADVLADLTAFAQVLVIDITLAGDNAIVVGLAVAGLPDRQKGQAIVYGIIAATVIRVVFGLLTLQLLAIVGLTLAGGVLLLWVCWKMYRELRGARHGHAHEVPVKTMRQAMIQIVLADVSMSLDNVLAVAGAAHDRPWVLVAGIVIAVGLMGLAARLVARLLERYRWIAWVGLFVVLFVALRLIWDGTHEVAASLGAQG